MKIVVLFSGGLDSTVVLAEAVKRGHDVVPLFINYDQRNLIGELHAATEIASHYKLILTFGKVLLDFGFSDLTRWEHDLPANRSFEEMSSAIGSHYVPCRNALFITMATAYAEAHGCDEVWVGFTADAASGLPSPDARQEFLSAMQSALDIGSKRGSDGNPVKLRAPFGLCTKDRIIREGRRLNAPLEMSWTCFSGSEEPCGTCDVCVGRKWAFSRADIGRVTYR